MTAEAGDPVSAPGTGRRNAALRRLELAMLAIGGAALAGLVAEYGFGVTAGTAVRLHAGELAGVYLFCFLQALKLAFVPKPGRYLRLHWFEFALVFIILFQLAALAGLERTPEYRYLSQHGSPAPLAAAGLVIVQVYFLMVGLLRSTMLQTLLLRLRLQPAATMAVSFAALILLGTLALKLPRSVAQGRELTWLDALFTATSAACVTGLTVVDTGSHFSALGQCLILVGIQLGGLGIFTFTAFIAVFSGRGLAGGEVRDIGILLEARSLKDIRRMLTRIVLLTFGIEAFGALLLFDAMRPALPDPFLRAFYAIFHSVSAFCNAGFSLYADSIARFRAGTYAMLTFMGLILAGSVGYPVLIELPRALRGLLLGRWQGLSRHVRIVLAANAALIAAGAPLFYLAESRGLLRGLGHEEAWLSAVFIPITARTCGFQTMDLAALSLPAWALLLGLMLIGGSPNSAAGGFKTTVLALSWARLRAAARGGEVALAGRPVDPAVLEKGRWVLRGVSGTAFVLALLLLASSAGPGGFLALVFEAVSATGTVGLSMGATAGLSSFGKLAIIAGMFLGRVLPACLVLSWVTRHPEAQPPRDAILVG